MYTQWYRYIYVLSHKKNGIFPFAVTKMELESEVNGEGNGSLPGEWHSCLENLVDRGAWWSTVHGVAKC